MKVTQILYKQHLDRLIRSIWYAKRERKILPTKTEKCLRKFGITVKDPTEVLPAKEKQRIERGKGMFLSPRIVFDNTHPDWKANSCLIFKDCNVLQEGVRQAQLLTNTIHLPDNSFSYILDLQPDLPDHVDDIIKRIIYTSSIFDAHQEPLPKRKNSEKPTWVFPRDYGITNCRKMQNLSRKLLQLCESLAGPDIGQKRCVLYDGITQLNLEKESELIQFTLRSDVAIMSSSPLKALQSSNYTEIDLPNIYPLHYTIGLDKINFYKIEDIYPVGATSPWINVHTIFVHYDPMEVRNLTELPVTKDQVIGRSMIKSYIAAASCARQKFGMSVKKLPEPVTVQCIQSDGKNYHFFVYQLNSLDTNDTSTKNFWCSLPPLTLYEKAQYDSGIPVLEGYNTEVFKRIFAFYKNGS